MLKFDADLANAEIITGDSDTVRIELIREFKVATAEEANALRQKLTLELGQVDVTTTGENSVKVTVRLADDLRGTNRRKMASIFDHDTAKFNLSCARQAALRSAISTDGRKPGRKGSLKLGNVSGEVTAKSEGGSVTIGNVGGNL